MKKINWFLAAIFAFASLSAQAQEKMLTIDAIYGTEPGQRVAFSGRLTPLQWNRDGSLRQVKRGEAGLEVYRFNALTGEAVPFYDKSKFEAAIVPLGIKAEDARNIANQPNYIYNSEENAIVFTSGNDLFYYNFANGSGKRLTNNAAEELEADFSPDGKIISFVRGMNLFVVDVASGREMQLTKDARKKFSTAISIGFMKKNSTGAATNAAISGRRIQDTSHFCGRMKRPCRNSFWLTIPKPIKESKTPITRKPETRIRW